MSYVCPKCHESRALWQEISISGWQAIDADLKPTGEREADWTFVEEEYAFGCGECDWQGARGDLEVLGTDRQPLPVIHRDQLSIEDAA